MAPMKPSIPLKCVCVRQRVFVRVCVVSAPLTASCSSEVLHAKTLLQAGSLNRDRLHHASPHSCQLCLAPTSTAQSTAGGSVKGITYVSGIDRCNCCYDNLTDKTLASVYQRSRQLMDARQRTWAAVDFHDVSHLGCRRVS